MLSAPNLSLSWRKPIFFVALVSSALTLLLAFTAPDPFFLAPFRESQTAISADYLLREPAGGMLAFQLPVLGAPWRIPLEFPLFQQLTAWVATSGIGVAQAGRLVNLLGFMGCLILARRLWRTWDLPADWGAGALAFLITSPLYAIYATSHMIESLALLLALLHLWGASRVVQGGRWPWLLVAIMAGVLAALVKITTWLPAATLVAILGVRELCRARTRGEILRRKWEWLGPGVIVGLGLAAGVLWSKWAAGVRSANIMNEALQSEGQLRSWVFGSLADRLSLKTWVLIGGKDLIMLFGPLGLSVPILLLLAWWKGGGRRNPRLQMMAFGLVGYFVHIFAFPRLNLRHDYYMFGAGVYLLFAAACALVVLAEALAHRWVRWLPFLVVISMAASSPVYLLIKRGYHDLAAEQAIAALNEIKEPGALLTFGFDWSPRVPFATGRKALMVAVADRQATTAAIAANRATHFAAIVVLGNADDEAARQAAEMAGLDPSRRVPFSSNGYLLLPPGAGLDHFPPVAANPILMELRRRVPARRSWPDGLVYKKSLFHPGGAGMVFVVKRGDDAFYLRVDRLQLVRVRGYFNEP